jgi:hypothetical protein
MTTFMIKPNWDRLNDELWKALERLKSAPNDMFIELLRYRLMIVGKDELDKSKNIEILNIPEKSRDHFLTLDAPSSEKICIDVLRDYYRILRDFPTDIAAKYKERLNEWIIGHNLRYRLTEDCQLELTISGLLLTEYEFLRRSLKNNIDRREALEDLEQILPNLSQTHQLRNCIKTAINLLEGITQDRTSIQGNTLTAALPGCRSFFPHESLMDCIRNIYKFCSDYPNLRHAGTSSNKIRNLKKDDALLMLTLTVGFGTFIYNNNSGGKILSGDI